MARHSALVAWGARPCRRSGCARRRRLPRPGRRLAALRRDVGADVEGARGGLDRPDFPAGWYMDGPFREHPAGLMVPAAALARLGYPAPQAAYALNALYQVLTIVLVQRLAATLVPGLESRALGWLVQLLPDRLHVPHPREPRAGAPALPRGGPLRHGALASHARFALLTVAGLVGVLLVKGVLAVFGPALCVLWLLARRLTASRPAPSDRAAWLGLAAGVLAMHALAGADQHPTRLATGEGFCASTCPASSVWPRRPRDRSSRKGR